MITRRDFLKGTAAAAAAAALGGCAGAASSASSAASSSPETKTSGTHTYADLLKWDAQYDVIVLGMGAAGLVSAKTAADQGVNVLLAEKMSEEKAGGNSKVCGQLFAYSNGDKDAAKKYYTALAAGRDIDEDVIDVFSESVSGLAESISEEFDLARDEFFDWTGIEVGGALMSAMSPEYPEMEGSDKMALLSTHANVSDSYLYNAIKAKVLAQENVDIWYSSPGVKLLQDPSDKTVIGVVIERNGEQMNVRANNGVVIATGGFECNKEMVQQYLGVINYAPRGGQYNTGDGIRMAQEAGADLWHMSCYEGLFGLGSVTWPVDEGVPCTQPATLSRNALNTGASMLVGTDGERFVNESEIVRHGHLYENGIWENPTFPEKVWLIYDETQMNLVKEAGLIDEDHLATIQSFDTIDAMAEGIGCDKGRLNKTIEAFNMFAENGTDYKCGREAQYMRPYDGQKYYAMYVVQGLLNTQGGPRRSAKAEILDTDGNPIPHLYSAGECGGITVCMYQGGSNIAECITFGRIAGKNAAEEKEALSVWSGEVIESNPAQPGEIRDGAEEKTYETGENQYIGKGQGINGDVVVRVTVEDGKISNVEVLEQNETENLGGVAAAELPSKFIGMSSADEIDGVDGITGSTITSNALKEAVKEALSQAQ